MLKRAFISLLAVLLIVAATTSVFAFNFPANNLQVTNKVTCDLHWYSNYGSVSNMSIINSGQTRMLAFAWFNGSSGLISTALTIDSFALSFTLDQYTDLYFVSPTLNVSNGVSSTSSTLAVGNLYPFYDSQSNIYYNPSVEGTIPITTWWVDIISHTYGDSNTIENYSTDFYFLKFDNVAPGIYTIFYSNDLFYTFAARVGDTGSVTTMTSFVPFGMYAVGLGLDDPGDNPTGGGIDQTYLDSWIDPSSSLQQNISNIQNTLNEAVAGSDDPDVQTFYAIYANYQLDLLQKENDLNFTNTVDNVETGFSQIINNYIAGNITYADALDDLSDSYVDSLADCESPEQGSYLTAVYQAKQTQLHYKAIDLAGEVIKDVISDEEIEHTENYYEKEEALISQFELQNLQDTVKFQEWYNLLGSAEALTYRSIFDWFLNTSSFKYWLIIPLSMIVITNLLGTVLYVSRHRAYNSRYSDRGNKND